MASETVNLIFAANTSALTEANRRLTSLETTSGVLLSSMNAATGSVDRFSSSARSGLSGAAGAASEAGAAFSGVIRPVNDLSASLGGLPYTAGAAVESLARIRTESRNMGAEIARAEASSSSRLSSLSQSARRFGGRIASSFRPASNVVQNSAYQFQDLAVQIQSGQSAFLAFSQQAPQFFGAFGPGGAVLGAVLAIGTAVGATLFKSLQKSKDASEELSVSMKALGNVLDEVDGKGLALTDTFYELSRSNSTLSQSQSREALLKVSDALDLANEKAEKLALSISPSDLGGRFDRISLKMRILRNDFTTGAIDLDTFTNKTNELFLQTEDPSADFRAVREELTKINTEAEEAKKKRDLLLKGTEGLQSRSAVDAAEKRAKEEAEAENKRLASLERSYYQIEDSLRSEEQVIIDSYNLRLSTIRAFSDEYMVSKEEAAALELKLEEDKNKKLEALAEKSNSGGMSKSAIRKAEAEAKAIEKGYKNALKSTMSEEELINASYDRKLEALRAYYDANQLYASEANDKIYQLEEARALKLEELAAKELKQKQDYEQQKTQATLTALSDVGSAITEMGEENSAAAKIGYAITQGIQVAQAINNANLAYTGMIASAATAAAVAGPAGPAVYAAGQAQAEVVRGIGYTTAGLIAGQSIASFEGGGMTPDGARVGGMDGKGGMLAMLHPNEKVTDLTKSANDTGAGVIVNVNIEGGTGNETVTSTESKDDQGRKIKNIVIQMANDKTSGLMKGIFSNTTAQPKGNR